MSEVTSHARKALNALRLYGHLVLTRHKGIPIWQAAKKSGGLKMTWSPIASQGMFMTSAIEELSKKGLIEWEAADRVKLRGMGE